MIINLRKGIIFLIYEIPIHYQRNQFKVKKILYPNKKSKKMNFIILKVLDK